MELKIESLTIKYDPEENSTCHIFVHFKDPTDGESLKKLKEYISSDFDVFHLATKDNVILNYSGERGEQRILYIGAQRIVLVDGKN